MSSDNTLPVLQALEEALAKGGITQYQAASWRSKFLEVHATLASAPAVEQQLLIEKKKKEVALEEARLQVEAEIAKREELKAEFESVDINKQSLAQEVATLEARDISLQQELTDLRTREGELRSEVEQLQHANQSTVSPVLNQIQSEIAQARKEIAETMSLTDSSVANSLQLKSRLDNINNAILINKHQLANLETELNRIKAEPRRINAITENIGGVLELCQSELSRLKTSLEARDAEIHEQESVVREVSELKATIDQKLGRYRTDIESREEEMLGLERSLKAEKSAQRDLFERKKQLAFDCDVLTTTSKSTKSSLDMVKSQHDRTLSAFKSKEEEYKNLVQSIPNLETRLKIRKSQINKLKARCIDFRKTRDEIQKQMDVLVAQYLNAETTEKAAREELNGLLQQCVTQESEKILWEKEKRTAIKQLEALKHQRDLKARELGKMTMAKKKALDQGQMNDLELIDLSRQVSDLTAKLHGLTSAYDHTKNERNNFVNSVQSTNAIIAELRERVTILASEAEVLAAEAEAKNKALIRERQTHVAIATTRDNIRAEVNRAIIAYRERQSQVETQTLTIDRLSSVISGLEREMRVLRKEYEEAVEFRNYTGVQVIDRNDELCVLYEKANIQESTLHKGEVELMDIDAEIRALQLSCAETERNITARRNRVPEATKWSDKILHLYNELAIVQKQLAVVSHQLETPGTNASRLVALKGIDPDLQVLQSRVDQLDEKVDSARVKSLEADVMIEDLEHEISEMISEEKRIDENVDGTAAESGNAPSTLTSSRRMKNPFNNRPNSAMPNTTFRKTDIEDTSKDKLRATTSHGTRRHSTALNMTGVPEKTGAVGAGINLARQVAEIQGKVKESTKRLTALQAELKMCQSRAENLDAEIDKAQKELNGAISQSKQDRPPTRSAQVRLSSSLKPFKAAEHPSETNSNRLTGAPPTTKAEKRPSMYINANANIPKPFLAPFRPFTPSSTGRNLHSRRMAKGHSIAVANAMEEL